MSDALPDAAQLGAVVVAVEDVVQDLEHQLPQLAVLHQRDGEERVQEGRRQSRRHGLRLEAGGDLRKRRQGEIHGGVKQLPQREKRLVGRA